MLISRSSWPDNTTMDEVCEMEDDADHHSQGSCDSMDTDQHACSRASSGERFLSCESTRLDDAMDSIQNQSITDQSKYQFSAGGESESVETDAASSASNHEMARTTEVATTYVDNRENEDVAGSVMSAKVLSSVTSKKNVYVDLAKLSEMVAAAKAGSNCIQDKDVLLLCGNTGSGKTSTLLFLGGVKFKWKDVDGYDHFEPVDRKAEYDSFEVAAGSASVTKTIQVIELQRDGQQLAVCDVPGLNDTNGVEAEIFNQLSLVAALKKARTVKPVLVFNHHEMLGGRANLMVEMLNDYVRMFGSNDQADFTPFQYIFTHCDEKNSQRISKRLRALLSERELDLSCSNFITDIISKTTPSGLTIDLEDGASAQELLDSLCGEWKEYISNPSSYFSPFLSQTAFNKLKLQLTELLPDLQQALKDQSYDYVHEIACLFSLMAQELPPTALFAQQIRDAVEDYQQVLRKQIELVISAMAVITSSEHKEFVSLAKQLRQQASALTQVASAIISLDPINQQNIDGFVQEHFQSIVGTIMTKFEGKDGSNDPSNVISTEISFGWELVKLKTLSDVFHDSCLIDTFSGVFKKAFDIACAIPVRLLASIESDISSATDDVGLCGKIISSISFSSRLSTFLKEQKLVDHRSYTPFQSNLEAAIHRFKESIMVSIHRINGATETLRQTNVSLDSTSLGIDLGSCQKERNFLIELSEKSELDDIFSDSRDGLSVTIRHAIKTFDQQLLHALECSIGKCEEHVEGLSEEGLSIETDVGEKRAEVELLTNKVNDLCQTCKVCVLFVCLDQSKIQSLLAKCDPLQKMILMYSEELTSFNNELAKSIVNALESARSFHSRLRNSREDTALLLSELAAPENWSHWDELIVQKSKSSLFGSMKRATTRFVSFFTPGAKPSEPLDELEKLLLAIAESLNYRIRQSCGRLFATGLPMIEFVKILVCGDLTPDFHFLLALLGLPEESKSFLEAIISSQKDTGVSQVVNKALIFITRCLSETKELRRTALSDKDFRSLGKLLSIWQESEQIRRQAQSFCAKEPARILSQRFGRTIDPFRNSLSSWPMYETLLSECLDTVRGLKRRTAEINFDGMKDCDSEDERKAFYSEVCRILSAARDLQFVHPHIAGCNVADGFSYQSVLEKIEEETRNVISRLDLLLSQFPSDVDCFPSIYKTIGNLQSIAEVFSCEQVSLSRMASNAIEISSGTMKQMLEEYCLHSDASLSTHEVVEKLLNLKEASIEIACWSQVMNKAIDRLIDSVISHRIDSSKFLLELSVALRSSDSPNALRLLQDHQCFAGAANAMFNEASAGQNIDYVLNGLDIPDEESEMLQKMYSVFDSKYTNLVNEGLNKLRIANENGCYDPSTSDALKDLTKTAKDVAADFSQTYSDQIVQITAYLFAYWSLCSLDSFAMLTSGHQYLMKPHAAQVIAIWSLLNCGCTKRLSLENKMLEVKTGEGKSIVLGITATILALFGFEVDCICYSAFLSERDWNAFEQMFVAMDVKSIIWYGTFKDICRKLLSTYWSLSNRVVEGKARNNGCAGVAMDRRCRVMLVDEVDVFFGPDAFGDTFKPACTIDGVSVANLYQYIWENHDSLISSQFLDSHQTQAEQTILQSYHPCVHELIKNKIRRLLSAAAKVKNGNHEYIVADGKIGYKDFDGVAFNFISTERGFAAIQEFEKGVLSESQKNKHLSLSFSVGRISNAELPFEYDVILGVTGTLQCVSSGERDILKQRYCIEKYQFIPSVFGENRLKFASNTANDVVICKSKEDHFLELKHEILRRQKSSTKMHGDVKRPVMVFFDSRKTLLDFYESSYMKDLKRQCRTITESARLEERTGLFQKATGRSAITLMIRDFGRGTDFKCHDKQVLHAGGVHVIQAFFSVNISEEIQVKGRTARQGADGSYRCV
mmetsp:Transcript_37635/g.91475  ORF Transcript_37635/g.91475 Transcript_37635/m.91475 type:complete len:1903 (+) Transcript_37635:230-5938(+)